MFHTETETPNRRYTPEEFEFELWLAKQFKRPPTYFIKDRPTYPYVPHEPTNNKYPVNFDLNFTE